MKRQKNWLWVLLFLGPSLLGFLIFIAFPILYSLVISFTDWNLLNPMKFVGVDNYTSLLRDRNFWRALKNTGTFIIGYLPTVMFVGLAIAVLLNSKLKFKTFFRGIYFLPVVTSWVAVSLVWKWVLNGQYGLLNYFLSLVGIHGPSWLTDPNTAMFAIIITSVWKDIGFIMVLYLGGLQGISPTLYESAEIDGANQWHKFRHVTLPGLRPTTFFVMMISLINSFQVFDQVNIMTGGGPGNATTVMVQNIYNSAFHFFEMGRASAMSWMLFLIIFSISLVQMFVEGRKR